MLALVCQYAHLKVDTLAHWQPVEITQCRSDGVVLAGADDQAAAFCMDCRRFIWWPVIPTSALLQ